MSGNEFVELSAYDEKRSRQSPQIDTWSSSIFADAGGIERRGVGVTRNGLELDSTSQGGIGNSTWVLPQRAREPYRI